MRRILDGRQNVFALQEGVVREDLVDGSPRAQKFEDVGYTDAVAANAGTPNGDAHMLIVKNDARSSILTLVVGFGQKSELHSSEFAVPLQIVGPPGWDAQSVFEESIFMHWEWTAATKQAAIAPGELVSGFKVVLPPFPARLRGQRYSDGAPLIPIRPSDLPFRVVFQNGECVWGRVRPLVLGSPTK